MGQRGSDNTVSLSSASFMCIVWLISTMHEQELTFTLSKATRIRKPNLRKFFYVPITLPDPASGEWAKVMKNEVRMTIQLNDDSVKGPR